MVVIFVVMFLQKMRNISFRLEDQSKHFQRLVLYVHLK